MIIILRTTTKLTVFILALLLITSCGGGSDSETEVPITTNLAPSANAGADFSADEKTVVSLIGSGSDTDGTITRFSWTQIDGESVALSGAETASASFDAPVTAVELTLSFQLTVTDDKGASATDLVVVTIIPVDNIGPTANAGNDFSANEKTRIDLTGLGTDSDGSIVSYAWSQTEGEAVTIINPDSANTHFIAPATTTDLRLVFQLSVTDDEDATATDEIVVTVRPVNEAPIANAGPDQTVNGGDTVLLNGSASSDPDDDTLSHQWSITSKPDDSQAELSTADSVETSFWADRPGDYVLSLRVSDGKLESAIDETTTTVEMQGTNITFRYGGYANAGGITYMESTDCSDRSGVYYSLVKDISRNKNYIGQITITDNGDNCLIQTNNIPNWDFNMRPLKPLINPQSFRFNIPKNPELAAVTTELTADIIAGIHLEGIIYIPIEPACYAVGSEPLGEERTGCDDIELANYPWRYNPPANALHFGINSIDWGRKSWHALEDGILHYASHGMSFEDNYPCMSGLESEIKVTGFAADGFPIYGPCVGNWNGGVTPARSSYRRISSTEPRQAINNIEPPIAGNGIVTNDWYDGTFRADYEYVPGLGNLDECNGAVVNGQYGYFFTESYPYTVNCLKGKPDPSFSLTYQQENTATK